MPRGSLRQVGNLPAEWTSFVGRRGELAEVRQLLSTARLVTLTGPGGVGKTRLALRVAAILSRALPGGAWLVDLTEIHDDALVPEAVAQALRVHDPADRSTQDVLRDFFSDRRALLILDGCEHLAQGCAEFAARLLREVDTVRVLATSREVLAVDGEQVFVVPPLALPGTGPAADGTAAAAVALFAERAAAVSPRFAVTAENADAVAAICHRLDGLPLAIELAAIRLRTLSIEQLLHRLDDRFAALDAGARAAPRQQRTLRAAVDWSFDLCTAPEQALWSRLSVFAGSFDLDAVEGICAGDDVPADSVFLLVDGLVAKSILQAREQDGQIRFRLLDTLRQYGEQRLRAAGAEAGLRRRHADWYLDLAERGEREWFGPRQMWWLARMQAEYANLRAAMEFDLSGAGELRNGTRLAGALWFHWTSSGPTNEAGYWLDRVLARDAQPGRYRAKALWAAGYVAIFRNELDRAAELLDQARAMAVRYRDRLLEAWIVGRQQSLAMLRGTQDRALALGAEALRLFEEAGDADGGPALVHSATATVHMFRGDPAAATAAAQRARAMCQARGERWIQCLSVGTLTRLALLRGDAEQAVELSRQAILLRRGGPLPAALLPALEHLSWATEATGQHERAAVLQGTLSRVRYTFAIPVKATVPSVYLLDPTYACEQRTRAALGERAYADAFRRGERMPVDHIAGYALGEEPEPVRRRPPSPRLTRREWQVAQLVGQGLSNRQIATQLVISQRTAESHIEHLLGKLGFTSRAQIAAWAAAQSGDDDEPAGHTVGARRSG